MPPFDEPTEEIRASLEVIDATLAGEPVDPTQAELAELTLLLAGERPVIDREFAGRLDRAIQRRFASVAPRRDRRARRVGRALSARWWVWTPAAGLAMVLAAAVVVVVAGPGSRSSATSSFLAASAPHRTSSAGSKAPAAAAALAAPSPAGAPPPLSGRETIQSGQLALSTAPSRIEQVSQEVFTVVGQAQGIVDSSTITATGGPAGYAQFQLSIPSSDLPQAMASLSTLRYARVASRTDTTQDVTDQYEADVRALADARALRTSLLTQLANATTGAQIDSLTARLHDAEASISSDQATLRNLSRQVDYSQVALTIGTGSPTPIASSGGGGFGLGQAAHDAGRVLTVAAGIALIGAAGLVPLALLGALAWWITGALRRHRREQALDLA